MAFYYEFFVEEDRKLIHVGSSDGSDTPSYFEDVKTKKDWDKALNEVRENNNYWPHREKGHPFPWKTYKTSDDLLVLRRNKNRGWFNFWIPKYEVWINTTGKEINNDFEDYFERLSESSRLGNEKGRSEIELLELPVLLR